jgi:hypothetical protein
MSDAPKVFYLAICQDCTPVLPVPFYDKTERDAWVAAHATTGHKIWTATETRT